MNSYTPDDPSLEIDCNDSTPAKKEFDDLAVGSARPYDLVNRAILGYLPLTCDECRVLGYIAARTIRYGKFTESISRDEFTNGIRRKEGGVLTVGTGLKKDAIRHILNTFETRKYITIVRKMSPNRVKEIGVKTITLCVDNLIKDAQMAKLNIPRNSQKTMQNFAIRLLNVIQSLQEI